MDGDAARYDTTPATMAEYARRFVTLGARIVGGCCGTSPAHVAAIAATVRPAPEIGPAGHAVKLKL